MGDAGSIIIPAHNEQAVIGRLLACLTAEPTAAEIVVVANGCTDGTAQAARTVPGVKVIETPVPSKTGALALGDREVSSFPRFYIDADVVIGGNDVRELASALREQGVHAVGPTRDVAMDGVSWIVRAYYAVWTRLPGVATELYGRGVIAVDEVGHRRLATWRDAMSDDLVAAMSFAPHELRVVSTARVLIRPPRVYRDLLRRRVRAMTGNRRLARDSGDLRTSGTGMGTLAVLARREPHLLPAIAVFLGTAAISRARARWAVAHGSTQWLRDESSRHTPASPLHSAASTARPAPER